MPLNLSSIAFGVEALAKMLDVETADLSTVPDPKGRLDYLASKIVEQAAMGLTPELQVTYLAARPLLDGLAKKYLGKARIQIPAEVVEIANKVRERGAA